MTRRRVTGFVVAFLGLALLIGVVASNFASSDPDGLESAVLTSQCDGDQQCLAEAAGDPVFDGAPLPDYANTPLSGLLGTVAVFAVAGGILFVVKRRRGPSD